MTEQHTACGSLLTLCWGCGQGALGQECSWTRDSSQGHAQQHSPATHPMVTCQGGSSLGLAHCAAQLHWHTLQGMTAQQLLWQRCSTGELVAAATADVLFEA
jgi:hypothetical protein